MGKIAWVFSGQGAQYPGMGKALFDCSPAAKNVLEQAERLRPGTLSMCFEGTAAALAETRNTQPCVMAVDCACAAALWETGARPGLLAGFSLGEIAALPTAGVMDFHNAFSFVTRRADAMAACAEANPGAMLAVLKLETQIVEALCAETGAYPANYNCPGQLVLSVAAESAPLVAEKVKQAGGRALPLRVSGGFHSPLMAQAAHEMAAQLETLPLRAPSLPLYANRTARPYEADDLARLLSEQIDHPVRWEETVRQMIASGADTFVELGPGKTLSGLIRRIDASVTVLSVEDGETLQAALSVL